MEFWLRKKRACFRFVLIQTNPTMFFKDESSLNEQFYFFILESFDALDPCALPLPQPTNSWAWVVDLERAMAFLAGKCFNDMLLGISLTEEEMTSAGWLDSCIFRNGVEDSKFIENGTKELLLRFVFIFWSFASLVFFALSCCLSMLIYIKVKRHSQFHRLLISSIHLHSRHFCNCM